MATSLKSRDTNQVLYLYGVTPAGEGIVPEVVGVDAAAGVEAVPCAGLVCWASRVNKTEFADNLARNMENLEWLAEVSVRHQQAVAAIAAARDILPARFGTVFRNSTSLAAHVEKHKAHLTRDLKRINGCEEWGVKVFRARTQPETAAAAKSGREYLRARAAALHEEAPRPADAEVQRLLHALEKMVAETAPGSGVVSRGQRGLLWQGSLLVKRLQRDQLQELMGRFSRDWEGARRIELSGPWPPYSFVSRGRETEASRG